MILLLISLHILSKINANVAVLLYLKPAVQECGPRGINKINRCHDAVYLFINVITREKQHGTQHVVQVG